MNNFFKKSSLFLIFVFWLWLTFAKSSIDPMNLPKITEYVEDYAKVIDQSSLNELSSLWEAYNSGITNQLVAILFPNRNWNELFDIGMKLFKENQIWQAWKNNWLLLLISTEEKKLRIIVWYWLEWILPDALVKRIIEKDIRPLINNGDFAGAVRAFYQRCSEAIDSDEASSMKNEIISPEQKEDWLWILGLILWFIIAKLIKEKKGSKTIKKIGVPLLVWIVVVLLVWLWVAILFWLIGGLIFGFTWFLPWRGGKWWFGWGGFGVGGFGWGWFSGGGWSSGGWWAGD